MDSMQKPLNVKTHQEAQKELSNYWKPQPQIEKISAKEAGGRILAEKVRTKINLPPFDRAAYDGFAVKAEDTFGAGEENPINLELKSEIHAGEKPDVNIKKGFCAEIATGAVIPEGADAVVMVEDTSQMNEKIEIRRAVSPGENISQKGSEIKKGELIAKSGQKISPQVHGAICAAGVREVKVIKKPHVAVISSGEELVSSGRDLQLGEIYDVNGPSLCDAVKFCGGQPDYLGIMGDDVSEIKKKVKKTLSEHDVVITSGGSSAGSKDILPEAIDELGEPGVVVHGLAQKPGKPTITAIIDDKPVFGLPGYPVSALMVFDQLVAPYLRELSKLPEPERVTVQARLTRKILPARGRRELTPIEIIHREGNTQANPLLEGSGAITSLANADGYIDIPIDREILEENEKVEVKLFGGSELA